jgi:S1-C subfamily serine protease
MKHFLGVATLSLLGFAANAAGTLPAQVDGQPMPSLAPIVQKVAPAVVNIGVHGTVAAPQNPFFDDPNFRRFFGMPPGAQPREREFRSAGSGVIVDARQGYIVTNAHVVENAKEITVTLVDDRELHADVVGADKGSDVAVIKIKDGKLPADEIQLADSSRVQVGDYVIAVGNPFGLQHTVTAGIVSALGRSGINPEGYESFIQTDAAINPGNSGGALVNLRGELVGINSAILSESGGNMGIGFAIPSNMVKSVMDQLIEFGEVKRGVLGVTILSLDGDTRKSLGLADDVQGALVSQVMPGSAAEKAGVAAGDVITPSTASRSRAPASCATRSAWRGSATRWPWASCATASRGRSPPKSASRTNWPPRPATCTRRWPAPTSPTCRRRSCQGAAYRSVRWHRAARQRASACAPMTSSSASTAPA